MYDYEIWRVMDAGKHFIAGFHKGDESRHGQNFCDSVALKEFHDYARSHKGKYELRILSITTGKVADK